MSNEESDRRWVTMQACKSGCHAMIVFGVGEAITDQRELSMRDAVQLAHAILNAAPVVLIKELMEQNAAEMNDRGARAPDPQPIVRRRPSRARRWHS